MDDEVSELYEKRWGRPWVIEAEREREIVKRKGKLVKFLGSTPLPTDLGQWTYMAFGDYTTGEFHTAMIYGEVKRSLLRKGGMLLRVHSSCGTSELFHASNCECREELDEAMRRIRRVGRGMIIYMNQEGGGNGVVAKIAAYSKVFKWNGRRIAVAKDGAGRRIGVYDAYKNLGYKQENRSFAVAAAILKYLGVKSVVLMTNNPKKIAGLENYGIRVKPEGLHIKPKNSIVKKHLREKARLLGHSIPDAYIKR